MQPLTNLSKGCFALIITWPDVHNAEYEVALRIQRAAKDSGLNCIFVNNEGFHLSSLGAEVPKRIRPGDVEFALSLHFESPKLFDAYTYTALWNPIEFYVDWGYVGKVTQLISHDDFVYSGSSEALRQVRRLKLEFPRLQSEAAAFYPSISSPVLEPKFGNKKIFYCGMNWEKINNQTGRHHDLLKLLDDTSWLSIYGPREFMGTRVWGDYNSYVAPIPFDGWSLIHEISKCGVCLVLMSDQHFHSGIASSRLYEGLAAGAIIITDDHPFFRERFGESLLYISGLVPARMRFEQIAEHMLWIESNPEEAKSKAIAAQKIFTSNYSLDILLTSLFAATKRRREVTESKTLAQKQDVCVEVIVPFIMGSIESLRGIFASISGQTYKNLRYSLILDSRFFEHFKAEIHALIPAHLRGEIVPYQFFSDESPSSIGSPRIRRMGGAIHQVLAASTAGYFCLITAADSWFSDHLNRLVRVLQDNPLVAGAYSGLILESVEANSVAKRSLDFLCLQGDTPEFQSRIGRSPSIFLFRHGAFSAHLDVALPDFDVLEHCLFVASALSAGGLKASTSATCVRAIANERLLPVPVVGATLQRNFLIDLGLLQQPSQPPIGDNSTLWKVSVATKARDQKSFPRGVKSYEPQAAVVFGERGNCLEYMSKGWSDPEVNWCWIDGTAAQLVMQPVLFVSEASYFIRVDCELLAPESNESQVLSVSVNGVRVISYAVAERTSRSLLTAPIPADVIKAGELLTVDIDCAKAFQPPGEARELSVRLFGLVIGVGEVFHLNRMEIPGDFNEVSYLEKYPDVESAVRLGAISSGYLHFLTQGVNERRRA